MRVTLSIFTMMMRQTDHIPKDKNNYKNYTHHIKINNIPIGIMSKSSQNTLKVAPHMNNHFRAVVCRYCAENNGKSKIKMPM